MKVEFRNSKSANEVILKGCKVGPQQGEKNYPLMIFPWIKDKSVTDMMMYHEVQIDSSAPTNKFFIYQYFSNYELLDIVEISPTKFIIVLVK